MSALVPELLCTDINVTRDFYVDVLGFHVGYERPEETFVYLTRGKDDGPGESADLMFEQIDGPGRRWITGTLEPPLGRGINLQIQVRDVSALFGKVIAMVPSAIYLPLECKSYRCGERTAETRQFVVQDPDGYLLRFAEDVHP